MAQLKDTTITGSLAVSGTTNLTGATQHNGDVTLYSSSGDSPSLIFQRGTTSDTLNDYKIVDSGGYIKVYQEGNSGTSGFTQVAELTNAGKLSVSTPPATNTTPTTTAWISPTDSAVKVSDVAVRTGDKLLIGDSSASNIVKSASGVTFDTTNTTDFLRKDGTWAAPPTSTLPNNYSTIYVSSSGALGNASPQTSSDALTLIAGNNIGLGLNDNGNAITINASVPSAGTTASEVGTTSSGGSATTYSKSDHVHNITSSTITSALGFTPTSNTGTVTKVTAGTGLNTTSNDTATDGGNFTTSGTLYLTKSGVTAGTYQGITVDKYGRVTSASNQGYTSNTGTVTSVRVQATSPVQSSTSTAQSSTLNTTISLADGYGDTKNPYGSKTAKYVLAAPNGSAGAPSFRALVASDIPALSYLSSSGGNVSGDITRSNYGTYKVSAWCYGTSTRSTNDNVTAGYYFYVPMNTTVSENPYLNVPTNSGTKLFATANGGIKVNRAGKYKVSGAVYMGTGSSNGKAGAYIFDSTTSFSTAGTGVQTPPSTSTEIVGCPAYGAGTDIVCVIPPKIISLESGHIVHLVGRCMTQAGKIYYTNKATYLLVEWVGD